MSRGFIKWVLALSVVLATGAVAGCTKDTAQSYALYRNSFLDPALRIHWATFDAEDGDTYNLSNCQMAARLLNANVTASARAEGKERNPLLGFWCEQGPYRESGPVPSYFPEAFPTDG